MSRQSALRAITVFPNGSQTETLVIAGTAASTTFVLESRSTVAAGFRFVPNTTGPAGTIGPTGPVGLAGLYGEVGPASSVVGMTGPNGLIGVGGIGGPTGPLGPTGPNLAGPQGPTGPSASIGSTGPIGPQGMTGATGPQGVQGPGGPTGTAGSQGTDCSFNGIRPFTNRTERDSFVPYTGQFAFTLDDNQLSVYGVNGWIDYPTTGFAPNLLNVDTVGSCLVTFKYWTSSNQPLLAPTIGGYTTVEITPNGSSIRTSGAYDFNADVTMKVLLVSRGGEGGNGVYQNGQYGGGGGGGGVREFDNITAFNGRFYGWTITSNQPNSKDIVTGLEYGWNQRIYVEWGGNGGGWTIPGGFGDIANPNRGGSGGGGMGGQFSQFGADAIYGGQGFRGGDGAFFSGLAGGGGGGGGVGGTNAGGAPYISNIIPAQPYIVSAGGGGYPGSRDPTCQYGGGGYTPANTDNRVDPQGGCIVLKFPSYRQV